MDKIDNISIGDRINDICNNKMNYAQKHYNEYIQIYLFKAEYWKKVSKELTQEEIDKYLKLDKKFINNNNSLRSYPHGDYNYRTKQTIELITFNLVKANKYMNDKIKKLDEYLKNKFLLDTEIYYDVIYENDCSYFDPYIIKESDVYHHIKIANSQLNSCYERIKEAEGYIKNYKAELRDLYKKILKRKSYIDKYRQDVRSTMEILNICQNELNINYELEAKFLFCIIVAGKNAEFAHKVTKSLCYEVIKIIKHNSYNHDKNTSILQTVKNSINMSYDLLRKHKTGNYDKIYHILNNIQLLDLKICSIETLEKIKGIGPKTSRLFVMWSRPNENHNHAILDVHILKWLRETCKYDNIPDTTPTKDVYLEIEKLFLDECKKRNKTPNELDDEIWSSVNTSNYRTGRFTVLEELFNAQEDQNLEKD